MPKILNGMPALECRENINRAIERSDLSFHTFSEFQYDTTSFSEGDKVSITGVGLLTRLPDIAADGDVQRGDQYFSVVQMSRKVFSAEAFGVTADGSTDDYSAMQKALDAIDVAGGGSLVLPGGTIRTSQKLLFTENVEIVGRGIMNTTIIATSSMESVFDYDPDADSFLSLRDFTLDGQNMAASCLRTQHGIRQGSSISNVMFSRPVSKGWECLSYIYAMPLMGLRFAGGDYGFFASGNTPFNGSAFYNPRISNTSEWAMYLNNTGENISNITIFSPTIEGVDGGGISFNQTGFEVIEPYFERVGVAKDRACIEMNNTTNVVAYGEIKAPKLSTFGAAQTKQFEINSNYCRMRISNGNSPSGTVVNGNNYYTASAIDLIGTATRINVKNFYTATREDATINKKIGSTFGTTATATGICAWGRGVAEFLTMVRTGDAVTSGKYLVSLRNFPSVRVYWVDPCDVATTENVTLSGEQTIDGVATSLSRVLVKNQNDPSENGVYVSAPGVWARASDANAAADITGLACQINSGSSNAGENYYVSSVISTIDVDAVNVSQFGETASVSHVGGIDNATFSVVNGELCISRASGSEGRYTVSGLFAQMEYQSR